MGDEGSAHGSWKRGQVLENGTVALLPSNPSGKILDAKAISSTQMAAASLCILPHKRSDMIKRRYGGARLEFSLHPLRLLRGGGRLRE